MKKILFLLTTCLLASNNCFAQYENYRLNKLSKIIKERQEEKDYLDGLISRVKNRSFVEETPEDAFKKQIVEYTTISDLAEDRQIMANFRSKYGDGFYLCKLYSSLVEIYISIQPAPQSPGALGGSYNKTKNEEYKTKIVELKEDILKNVPNHKQEFIQSIDDLKQPIEDYRFAMFELARVMNLVNERKESKEPAAILRDLKKDEETYYIDKIPFTRDQLKRYVEHPENREKQIEELKSMCAEAFLDNK